VAFTHQLGDGLHSAIIKATKPTDPSQANGGTSLRPLLVADPPGQRGDPWQLAGGDQTPRRTTRGRRRQHE
jgi:hypothetical protein